MVSPNWQLWASRPRPSRILCPCVNCDSTPVPPSQWRLTPLAVAGDLTKKDAMRAEMRKASYASVRGPYKYGNNHIPIQNFYLQDVVKGADGELSLKTVATIVKDDQDRFHEKCSMK